MRAPARGFTGLDVLRAGAALSILAFHGAYEPSVVGTGSWLRPFAVHLQAGVTVFFVLSGFLLYRPFALARLRGRPAPGAAAYAWRRVLRIVPAYWLALLVIGLALPTGAGQPAILGPDAPWFFGLAQVYRDPLIVQGIGQAWTLGVEVAFYALVPAYAAVVAVLARRRHLADGGAELIGLAGLVAVSVAWKLVVLRRVPGQAGYGFDARLMVLPNFTDQFALGMGLAWLSASEAVTGRSTAALSAVRRAPWAAWLLAAGVVLVLAEGSGNWELARPVSEARWLLRHLLYGMLALALVAPGVLEPAAQGRLRHVLGNRGLAWLGLISYGIYLWHVAVMHAIRQWFDGVAGVAHHPGRFLVAALAGSIGLGALSFYLVERPALRLRRLVASAPEGAAAAPTAVADAPPGPPDAR